jgi:hypothetical protein
MRLTKELIKLIVRNYIDLSDGQTRQVAKYVIENYTPQERYRIAQNALKIYHAAKGN